MSAKILGVEYHRNGIGGEGFYVVTFVPAEDPKVPMVAVVFSVDVETADGKPRKNPTEKIAVLRCTDVAKAGIEQDGGLLSMDADAAFRGADYWGADVIAAIRARNKGTLFGYTSDKGKPFRDMAQRKVDIMAGK